MNELQTPPARTRAPRWVVPVVSLAVVLVVGLGGLVVSLLMRDDSAGATTDASGHTTLYTASYKCGIVGDLSDADTTLALDSQGSTFGSGPLSAPDLVCVFDSIGMPGHVRRQMESTQSAERQTATWGPYEASWVKTPGSGLDVILRIVA